MSDYGLDDMDDAEIAAYDYDYGDYDADNDSLEEAYCYDDYRPETGLLQRLRNWLLWQRHLILMRRSKKYRQGQDEIPF
jgi:hypothetical protein